ncbi:MAG: TIGR01458 family HAD-type hydrolase [Gammaproteobacteria bacterium]|nr:TIGR01458 family HAD-type hydrolase [Gammaproteobacteria bacterium]
MPGLLIDLDGVLYEGDHAIAGAAEAVTWCREQGIPHLFLTNTTSRPRRALVPKLARIGIAAEAAEILAPPFAAALWLRQHGAGRCALFVASVTLEEFASLPVMDPEYNDHPAAVVIGDLGQEWSFERLNEAFRLLMSEPRPQLIALGLTRYWRAADGLQLDAGPFVKALEYASGIDAIVMGKPAAAFFEMALGVLGTSAADTWMIGDDIRTDIAAAQHAGIHGLLVRTGKFRPQDLELGIVPDGVLPSIAALPAWWRENIHE